MNSDTEEEAHDSLIKDIRKINSDGNTNRTDRRTSVRAARESLPPVKFEPVLKKIGNDNLKKQLRPLDEPLDAPKSKRIRRAAGFENVTDDVSKWGGIVDQRRKADQLIFPVERVDCRLVTTEKNFRPSMKSSLEQQVYGLLHGAKLVKEEKETEEETLIKRAMSLQQIREESKRQARSRGLKQRLERKAAFLNKSKNRKHRQVLRREKLKTRKETFERLKMTDPAAALEVLDEIERTRLRERMDLRHKNSKWLKLQKKRCGQDATVRDLLAENSEIRTELLEKLKISNIDEDEDDSEDELILKKQAEAIKSGELDSQNAWVKQLAVPSTDKDPEESFVNMKKYWQNLKVDKMKELGMVEETGEKETEEEESHEMEKDVSNDKVDKFWKKIDPKENKNNNVDEVKKFWSRKEQDENQVDDEKDKIDDDDDDDEEKSNMDDDIKSKNDDAKENDAMEEGEKETKERSVDELFDGFEKVINKRKKNKNEKKIINPTNGDSTSAKKPHEHSNKKTNKNTTEKISNAEEVKKDVVVSANLNTIKDRKLGTARPDYSFMKKKIENESSDEEADEELDALFNDDENVKLFEEEKKAQDEKNKVKDVNNYLSGWGSWGGPGIVLSEAKKKKFTIKAPKVQPNKYAKIGNVIYNEKNDVHTNLRKLMVSDLPFPFTSVKDFEASVRQPIGSKFVPETVHRKLIAPSVIHKMGQVIYPMNEDVLIKEHDEKKKKETSKLESKINEKLGYRKIHNSKHLKKKTYKIKRKNIIIKPLFNSK